VGRYETDGCGISLEAALQAQRYGRYCMCVDPPEGVESIIRSWLAKEARNSKSETNSKHEDSMTQTSP
jgi:hypothetical protein